MKKLELQQLIREEIRSVLLTESFSQLGAFNEFKRLIDAVKLSVQRGSIDDGLFKDYKNNFIETIQNSLARGIAQVPGTRKKEVQSYVRELLGPLKSAGSLAQFATAMITVYNKSIDLRDRFSIQESLLESRIVNWFKRAKTATADWWENNKRDMLLYILEILAEFLVHFVIGIINAILKSKIEAPEVNFRGFGGGRSGGGGADTKW
jgi:hypothetical protein